MCKVLTRITHKFYQKNTFTLIDWKGGILLNKPSPPIFLYNNTKELVDITNFLLFKESTLYHSQIVNNTDRTLDVVFSRFRCFFVHNNPEEKVKRNYAHAALNYKTKIDPFLRRILLTPVDLYLRIIILEKTTSSVLSIDKDRLRIRRHFSS